MNAHRWPISSNGGQIIITPTIAVATSTNNSISQTLSQGQLVNFNRLITPVNILDGQSQQENRSGQIGEENATHLDNVYPFPLLRPVEMVTWPDTLQQRHLQHQQQQIQQQQSHLQQLNTPPPSDVSGVRPNSFEEHPAETVDDVPLELTTTAESKSDSKEKRKRNPKPMPETWKKNLRKNKRAKGEAYQSATGKEVPAKSIKNVDCTKCRLSCEHLIDMSQRESIFESYWGTGSYLRQRDFICSHVIEEEKARTTVKGEGTRKREFTRQYWLPKKSGKLVRVCKSFFLATLDIGCKTIDYALKKRKGGFFCDDDQRGRHEPTNKVPEEKLDDIRQHIESFWHLNQSPNKKKKNGRIILPPSLNIRKMYQMYKDSCFEKGETAQKEHIYRRIFNMEYNITFYEPKKEPLTKEDSTSEKPVSMQKNKPSTSGNNNSTEQQRPESKRQEMPKLQRAPDTLMKERAPHVTLHSQQSFNPSMPPPHHLHNGGMSFTQQPPCFPPRGPIDGAVNMSMSPLHHTGIFLHQYHS